MSKYTELITNYHRGKVKFTAHVDLSTGGILETSDNTNGFISKFDIDNAAGEQLDILGLWIGRTREITAPIENYFFSFDSPSLGFDYGTWKNRYDPESGIIKVGDVDYRTMLRAKIGANNWDGTSETLPAILQSIYPNGEITITYSDNQDMTMTIFIAGDVITNITKEIIRQGYLAVKPAGVTAVYKINGE
ncbi:DUF2612 domain-containing protein [Cedecea sp. MMO-103]|uniref:DUF2612 domain-containing protein n=1 Tax=Cedecea sp. MMO-103 TaxID=3081238 RepID=UPI003015CA69